MHRGLQAAVAFVVITLLLGPVVGCTPANRPPEIVSLESRSRVIAPGDSVLIECVATDADGDALTYEWAADRGVINGFDGVVAWTAPSEEGLARITVKVGDGGEEMATQSITIVVKRNVAPVISGVTADLDWVHPGESVSVRCQADDADGDELSYSWTSTCGQISGDGAIVTWTAPDTETECTITVVVADPFDGKATAATSIVASEYEPLLVSSVTVTAIDEPYYIVPRIDWYKVYWEDSYVIEAHVTSPERIVSWEWSDGGPAAIFPVEVQRIAFDGGPSRVKWTAPKAREELIMTVTVRDNAGNTASKSITLYVDTCTCAFPQGDEEE